MRLRPIYVYAAAAAAVLAVAAAAWAWRAPQLTPAELLGFLQSHARDPLAPLLVVAVYVAAGAMLVPVTALIALTGLAFGPVLGAIYALLGASASGACAYAAGHHLSAGVLQRYAGPRVQAVRRQLKARGLLAMILVRIVPSGPYTVVNLIAGASGIRFRDFMLGTLIGLTPGIVTIVGLVHGIRTAWESPGPASAAILLLLATLVLALAVAIRHAARRRDRDQ